MTCGSYECSGLQVIDVSTPSQPEIIASISIPGGAGGVTVIGDTVFVDGSSGLLYIIDVSTPSKPVITASVDTPGWANGVAAVGDTLFVADGGLQVIDVSTLYKYKTINSVDTPHDAMGVAVSGDTAFVADGSSLQVFDVSTPSQPEIISSVDMYYAKGVAVSGNTVFVADDDGSLHVIDVSTPSQPAIIGTAHTEGSLERVAVSGNTVFVVDSCQNMGLIDISTPSQPVIVSSSPDSIGYGGDCGTALGVTVIGDTAFMISSSDGLKVIDVSTPSQPVIIGSVDTPGGGDTYIGIGMTVIGNTAFVADRGGLQVIDVSTPSQPVIIGSVETPGSASGVAVIDDTAFVADWDAGLQVIDVSTPSHPVIISSLDTPGYACDVTVSGDTVYVADGGGGLFTFPLNLITKISPIIVNSENSISAILPSPPAPGHYTLRVSNPSEYDELFGAVTFSDTETYEDLMGKKAVIVQGTRANDPLRDAFRLCANQAYLALLFQGYTRENILYLGPNPNTDIDGDRFFNDIDGEPTAANLENAVTNWADGATELLIYMIDHGISGEFHLSETEKLSAADLDRWLDTLQTGMSGRVIFIYDACMSGSFIPLMQPPEGKERVLITSTSADKPAWIANGGRISFSYEFWASVFIDASLYRSFDAARGKIRDDQPVHLDANADTVGYIEEEKDVDREDKLVIQNIMIGRGLVAMGSPPPTIGIISPEQTLESGETSAPVTASDITPSDDIRRVWAIILPPDYLASPETPLTDLPETELTDPDGDGTYEGTHNGFDTNGTYRVTVYAEDSRGTYSPPAQTTVVQTAIPDNTPTKGDLDGDKELTLKDAVTALKLTAGDPLTIPVSHLEADVDGDKRIGLEEAVYVLQKVAGLR